MLFKTSIITFIHHPHCIEYCSPFFPIFATWPAISTHAGLTNFKDTGSTCPKCKSLRAASLSSVDRILFSFQSKCHITDVRQSKAVINLCTIFSAAHLHRNSFLFHLHNNRLKPTMLHTFPASLHGTRTSLWTLEAFLRMFPFFKGGSINLPYCLQKYQPLEDKFKITFLWEISFHSQTTKPLPHCWLPQCF